MPVPKRKRSRARRDSRHAHRAIKPKTFAGCSTCQEPVLPHQVCKSCGHYKGVKVLTPKKERAAKRVEVRQTRQAAQMSKMKAAEAAANANAESSEQK